MDTIIKFLFGNNTFEIDYKFNIIPRIGEKIDIDSFITDHEDRILYKKFKNEVGGVLYVMDINHEFNNDEKVISHIINITLDSYTNDYNDFYISLKNQ